MSRIFQILLVTLTVMSPLMAEKEHERAKALFDAGRYQDALPLLNELVTAHPTWEYPLLMRGRTHLNLKQYDEALADFKDMLTMELKQEQLDGARYYLAKTHMARKDYPAATEVYRDLITRAPEKRKTGLYLNLAQAQMKLAGVSKGGTALKHYDGAIDAFDAVLQNSNSENILSQAGYQQAYALYKAAQVQPDSNYLKRAIQSCETTLKKVKDKRLHAFQIDLHFRQVKGLQDQKRRDAYAHTATVIDGYLKAWGDDAKMFKLKGQALQGNGDYKGALPALEQAVKLKPEDGNIHFALGSCRMMTGAYEDALKDFEQASKYGVSNDQIYAYRVRCYLDRKTGCAASDIHLYERAVALLDEGILKGYDLQETYMRAGSNLHILRNNVKVENKNHGFALANIQVLQTNLGRLTEKLQRKRQTLRSSPALADHLGPEINELETTLKQDRERLEKEFQTLGTYIKAAEQCGQANAWQHYERMKVVMAAKG